MPVPECAAGLEVRGVPPAEQVGAVTQVETEHFIFNTYPWADEVNETVVVDISAVSAGASESGTQQVTVTITDDDATPTVTLSVSPATLLEDGTDSPATLTATLSGATTVPVTVPTARRSS